jgi:4-azaleucine resistance transporter AzlC
MLVGPIRFSDGIRASLPVVLGFVACGLAFGVIARTTGLSVAEVALMSLILYAGSAQFIITGLLGASAAPSAIIFTVFLVNLRHLLYSASLAPHVRHLPVWKNILIGTELTDETFSVASSHLPGETPASARWMLGLNITCHLTWIIATVAGAIVGSAIADMRSLGLDFALTAMFAALLVIQLKSHPRLRAGIVVLVIGAGIAVGGATIIPTSWALIAATLVAVTIGKVIEEKLG